MKALIIGATGATGKDLVQTLLQDQGYREVVIFVRRATGISDPKLTEVLTDFDKLENAERFINGDVWFSCLGTTLKTAGSKEKQWQIDYSIPAKFAEIARQNGVPKVILLSAYGASAKSRIFYSKIKGSLEDKISSLSFDQYIVFRPGLLLRENTDRFGERISARLLKMLNRLGLLRKFRPMPTLTLAQKMSKAPSVFPMGMHIIELDKIFEL
ncbi:MAG TPA: NAD(P)H-binding protein [Chitinophagaceae bacterium]